MKNDQFAHLEEDLKALNKSMLSDSRKNEMKTKLFERIVAEEKLVNDLALASERIVMDRTRKAEVKESMLEKIGDMVTGIFSWQNLLAFNKKLVGSALALAMFFSVFLYLQPASNFVSASEISFVNSFNGQVWVYRDGEMHEVSVGFEVEEGDEIITSEDGEVEIYFFDDSAARVAPNSKLSVKQLSEWKDNAGTYVEISVESGRVWSKVVNLVEEKSEFVVEVSGNKVSTDGGAFDVEVTPEKTYVGVFNNSVDVKDNAGQVQKVISGQKVVATNNVVVKEKIGEDEKQLAWVKNNLKVDNDYLSSSEKKLITAKIEALGEDINDPNFSLEKSLDDMKLVLLDFDDVDQQKELFALAEKRLLSVQSKFANGEEVADDLKKAIVDFKEQADSFYALIDEVAVTDVKYAADLKAYLDGKIMTYKKEVAVLLPTSPSYEFKDVINELELKTIDDPIQAIEVKVTQIEDKLSEVESVKDIADVKVITEETDQYFQDVKQVVEDIEKIEDEAVKIKLLDDVMDNLQVLDDLSYEDSFEVKVDQSGNILSPLL